MVILQGDTDIAKKNVTDVPATISWGIGGLNKNTNYVLKVFARNYVFEGNSSQKAVQTNLEGKTSCCNVRRERRGAHCCYLE